MNNDKKMTPQSFKENVLAMEKDNSSNLNGLDNKQMINKIINSYETIKREEAQKNDNK